MSMTQTIIGGGVVVAICTALIQAIMPAPAPITVHSLAYADGIVQQDRTVVSDGPFYATWAAVVRDAATDLTICAGEGSWPYKPGRLAVDIPLSEWVGEPCFLSPGSYRLSASWSWGDSQTGAESAVFEVTE